MAFYQTVELFLNISYAKFKNNKMFWSNNRQNNALRVTTPLGCVLGQVYVTLNQSEDRLVDQYMSHKIRPHFSTQHFPKASTEAKPPASYDRMETRTRMKNKPTIKRLLANKCERERVRKINEAFEILKTHIPYCDSGRIRTKLDVLKFAIDYIEILTKMVSQSEAATLLKMTQLEKNSAFKLSTETSTTESPRTSNEMFPEGLEGATTFPFGDQNCQLVSEIYINVEHKKWYWDQVICTKSKLLCTVRLFTDLP